MTKTKRSRVTRTKLPSPSRASRSAFVLGRHAFAKVSAVEGIHVSNDLEIALSELTDADGSERRDALAEKYGRT